MPVALGVERGARAERIESIVPVHAPIPPALRSASSVDYRTCTKENRHHNKQQQHKRMNTSFSVVRAPVTCSLRGWGKHVAPTSCNQTQGAFQVLSAMFAARCSNSSCCMGASRAFVSLFPSRGSHPNMRPRNLKERRDTPRACRAAYRFAKRQ